MSTRYGVADTEYYDLLSIPPDASQRDIRTAYRKKVRIYDPDRNPGGIEMMKKINEAYGVLSDEEKRGLYNRFGKNFNERVREQAQFSNLFREREFSRNTSRLNKTPPIIHQINVTLDELYTGCTKLLAITKRVVCETCRGLGTQEVKGLIPCNSCGGRGKITSQIIMNGLLHVTQQKCTSCKGTGKIILDKYKCTECRGSCIIEVKRTVEVNIDKGRNTDDKIIIPNEGEHLPDYEPGDLMVIIKTKKHNLFTRKGEHLYITHTLNLYESLVGYTINIPYFDNRIINVCSGENDMILNGEMRIIRGLGMPIFNRPFKYGNLFIKFVVAKPNRDFITHERKILLMQALFDDEDHGTDSEISDKHTHDTIDEDDTDRHEETIIAESYTGTDEEITEINQSEEQEGDTIHEEQIFVDGAPREGCPMM